MMKFGVTLPLSLLTCLAVAFPSLVCAETVLLRQDKFQKLVRNTAGDSERFESYPAGVLESPLLLVNNVVYDAPAPIVYSAAEGMFGPGLTDYSNVTDTRTLIVMEEGVNAIAIAGFLQSKDEYEILVTTTSGEVFVWDAVKGGQFGGRNGFVGIAVSDDYIASVSFTNVGGSTGIGSSGGGIGNYAFESITTYKVNGLRGRIR